MKTLKLAMCVALGSLVTLACTSSKDGEEVDVTAETSDGDTSGSAAADAAHGEDESTQTSTTSDDDGEPDADSETSGKPDANSETSGAPDADVVTETETDAGVCELPEAYPPTCEACLSDECNDPYLACYCDEDCAVQWEALGTCFGAVNSFDDPSEDPAADWDTCMNAIGGDDASPLLFDLLDCVGEFYEPPVEDAEDDPYNRVEGDSQCSAACFSVYTFDEL